MWSVSDRAHARRSERSLPVDPFTAGDVGHMVDNCSRTARLGARGWGPRFQSAYEQIAFPSAERPADTALLAAFDAHPVHEALAAAAKLRPSVDISVA